MALFKHPDRARNPPSLAAIPSDHMRYSFADLFDSPLVPLFVRPSFLLVVYIEQAKGIYVPRLGGIIYRLLCILVW